MDIQLEAQIENTIRTLVSEGEMFTAYDVTRILRSQGVQVYHSQVRSVVYQMFNNDMDDNYTRTLFNLGQNSAFVYHHAMEDPSDYDQNKFDVKDDSEEKSDIVMVYSDYRNRIYVGPGLIRKLNVERGDIVYIYSEADGELIITDCPRDSFGGKTYTVDKDDAIRIGQTVSKAAGLKGFAFEASFEGGAAGRYITITNLSA